MNETWQDRKSWSDRFNEEIRQVLGLVFFKEASLVEDQKHATDFSLVFHTPEALRIGCRMRRESSKGYFRKDFSLRSWIFSNQPTELDKIMSGWGSHLFYGLEENGQLGDWYIIDLNKFRKWNKENKDAGDEIKNKDGRSSFRVYSFVNLPKECIFAHGHKTILGTGE